MPCVQAPKDQPPANAKGGPFDTEQECRESLGTTGGCPCCWDNDCAKCYCLLKLTMGLDEYENGDCPNGYVQAFDDTGALFPTCVKVIPDFDCNAPLTCVPPQKYIDRGDNGLLESYKCCKQSCTAPTSSMVADNSISKAGFRAFDGSDKYYKRLALYDFDTCTFAGYSPDDGYFILEKNPCDGRCVVVESVRRYLAVIGPPGAVVDCYNGGGFPTHGDHPRDSATWWSYGKGDFCGNPDGDRIYLELTEEITL